MEQKKIEVVVTNRPGDKLMYRTLWSHKPIEEIEKLISRSLDASSDNRSYNAKYILDREYFDRMKFDRAVEKAVSAICNFPAVDRETIQSSLESRENTSKLTDLDRESIYERAYILSQHNDKCVEDNAKDLYRAKEWLESV